MAVVATSLRSSVGNGQSGQEANAPSLDFNRAMSDFQWMFPSIDKDIIEDVLRSNKGGVDDTIDQLLVLAMDDDPDVHRETIPKTPDIRNQMLLPDERRGDNLLAANNREIQPLMPGQLDLPPSYESLHPEKCASRYNPPLIGPIGDDFLRLPNQICSVDVTDSTDEIYAEIDRQNRRDVQKKEGERRRALDSYRTHLGLFSVGASKSVGTPSSAISPRRRQHAEETHKRAEKLKELMIENEWKRQVADDPDLVRYLEDERVALMLQNREFMKELRRNKEFMNALHRELQSGHQNQSASINRKPRRQLAGGSVDEKIPVPDGPLIDPSQISKTTSDNCWSSNKSWRKRNTSKLKTKSPVPDGPSLDPIVNDLNSAAEHSVDRSYKYHENEGLIDYGDYGGDRLNDVDPFPFTKRLPAAKSVDIGNDEEAFVKRLTSMGKVSRQKFALLARRFASRSRANKSLTEPHYSDVNLLDSTDDMDYNIASASSVSSSRDPQTTAYAYNQPAADTDYNIGNNPDLNKQGAFFGNR